MSFCSFKRWYLQTIHLKIICKQELALNNHQTKYPNLTFLFLDSWFDYFVKQIDFILADRFYNVRLGYNLRRLFIIFSLSYNVECWAVTTTQYCRTSVWMIYILAIPNQVNPRSTIHFNCCVCCLEIRVEPHGSVLLHSSYITISILEII